MTTGLITLESECFGVQRESLGSLFTNSWEKSHQAFNGKNWYKMQLFVSQNGEIVHVRCFDPVAR